MHNDEPTLIDSLERTPLIKEVGETIAHCKPPQVFGIHGDWGLGKTSFLHQVEYYLTGECPQQSEEELKKANECNYSNNIHRKIIRTIWFDAWRYQHDNAPVVALLQEMRAQLTLGHQFTEATKRAVETVVRGGLHSLEGLTKQIGFQYSKFKEANREWETNNFAYSLPSHALREHLQKAIAMLLPQELNSDNSDLKPRLVIFIDDIDRCEPEVAYRLLEGLKIYLTLDNCVCILGMNKKAVENAIGFRILGSVVDVNTGINSSENQTNLSAVAYMEKLCQNVWQLPAIQNTGQVLVQLLEATVTHNCLRECIEQVVKEIQCLPPNPRRLKGLANLIGRLYSQFSHENSSDEAAVMDAKMLLIVAYVYQFHLDIYIRWEAEPDFYNKIYDWCFHSKTNIEILRSLKLPKQIKSEESTATPLTEIESTYPDPTELYPKVVRGRFEKKVAYLV